MKTFLHVGTHKTGTTLIQRFAAANRAELKKRGLWYPNYDFPGQPGHYTHHHFARAVAGEVSNQIRPGQLEAFVGRLAADAEQPRTLLLSSELAYRLAMKTGENVRVIEGAPKTAEETFWRRRGAYLTRLSRTLAPLNPEVVIVLRGQGDYARSLYQEQVKASRYTESLRTFLKDYRSRFEYFRQIGLLRELVGPVKILIYEDLCEGGGLLENFFAALGVDIRDMRKPSGKNRSFPVPVTEFLRRVNCSRASEEDRQHIILTIGNMLRRHPDFAAGASMKNWITDQEFAGFLAQFEAGNAQVLDWTSGSTGRATLFPDPKSRNSGQGGSPLLGYWKTSAMVASEMVIHRVAETSQIARCLKWIATS